MSSSREGALLRGERAARAVSYRELAASGGVPSEPSPVERRSTIRRAADQPVPGERTTFRLGDVYAEELTRLREQAHAEGYAAGYAEGVQAAEVVVAEEQRAAAERLAEAQTRWERRLVSATAALDDLPDTVTVLADERVERAGALAETGARHVDAQLGPALQRVQAVLTS